jgi:hypothetical protein
MPTKRKYKIIASFLLTIFSVNTVVGFACSVGIDMGFNSKHHHDEESTEAVVHIHADGKKHITRKKRIVITTANHITINQIISMNQIRKKIIAAMMK